MITVHDFTMLGKSVPEERKSDGRAFVCSAGYSPTLRKLIRIYPLGMRDAPPTWSISRINLERNPKDPREESFQIAGDRDPTNHHAINRNFIPMGTTTKDKFADSVPQTCYAESIQEANERRISLALIQPKRIEVEWTRPDSRDPIDMHQLELLTVEDSPPPTRIPRIAFTDQGGDHHLQLREWGAHEYIRKNGIEHAADTLPGALHLRESTVLLVGNMSHRRTVWLVISTLNIAVQQQLPMFNYLGGVA